MKVKEVLQRDPSQHPLVNQGQARISDQSDDKVLQEVRGELSTFVCEGQYLDGILRMLSSFLANLGHTSQKAAWVCGFFGSGKSHLLKMLCHLWADTKFPDGATARGLVPNMPDELRDTLRELDTAGKRSGGLLAAAGALPSGSTDHVRHTILSILLRGVGLPDQYPLARFCLWLHERGWHDRMKSAVEQAGKVWHAELNNLYVSPLIAKHLLSCDPSLAATVAGARELLKAQFPPLKTDITTSDFLTTFKQVLKLVGRGGRPPCTVLILDEVQQFIGEDGDRSMYVTEVAEAVSKQLDGQVLLVGAGQSALSEVRLLQKLLDRFTIRVALSDSDVQTVTRKVLLQKKPSSRPTVQQLLDDHGGEVSRQLQGTRIGESAEDRATAVDDYPLLPVRRRFWEQCFRQVDAAGTNSQLRSQLRIIHDAVGRVAGQDLGAVIPGDELYSALAPEMVNTGVLLREINERIINLAKDGTPAGRLASRVCGLIFLVGKLPHEAGADIGLRATKENLADLLVSDLCADNGKLRSEVEACLQKLAADGVLLRVGDEFRLQTKEGAEWDREFRNRQARFAADDATLQIRRDELLYAEFNRVLRTVKTLQGAAKEARTVAVSRDQVPPTASGESIPLWLRDLWSAGKNEVPSAARAAGTDSPVVFAAIPRSSADDVRALLIEAEAAQQTLDARGVPTSPEGQDALKSMQIRRDVAVKRRDDVIRAIVASTQIYLGGGGELLQPNLDEKLREAISCAQVRLFPRFKEADSAGWASAIKRARDGSDQPLVPVGHTGPTEQHPVCAQLLATIGSGKVGSEIRKALKASPFGWPQDAIDACLIALQRSQHLTVTQNGVPVQPGTLDQNKIQKAEFRVENRTLATSERLALRGLFQQLDLTCKKDEEPSRGPEFIERLLQLAAAAAGEAPLPEPPRVQDIEDLRSQVGTALLTAILDRRASFEKLIKEWKAAKSLAAARLPAWSTLERLDKHARGLDGLGDTLDQVAAIRAQRLLLLTTTDPVAPLKGTLVDAIRKAVRDADSAYDAAYTTEMRTLEQNDAWQCLSDEDRAVILDDAQLTRTPASEVSSDDALLADLDARPLSARDTETDALRRRIQRAIEQAAKLHDPEVHPVTIERATLRSAEDVNGWIDRQRTTLLKAVKAGPVLVN